MEIYNEEGIISIESDGFLSCLKIKKPKALDFPDAGGTIARYFVCLPYNKEHVKELESYRTAIAEIKDVNDFVNSGFIGLLKTGKYKFSLCKDSNVTFLHNFDHNNSNIILKEQEKNERLSIHKCVVGFYPPMHKYLLFTRPQDTLEKQQVEYYQNKISKGERPISIIIQSDDENVMYVLDGHHKLAAYQNLGIDPFYILIEKVSDLLINPSINSFLPDTSKHLFKCQIDHILTYGIDDINIFDSTFSDFFDGYLNDSKYIKYFLIMQIYNNANIASNVNIKKKQWFVDRLKVIKNRILVNETDLILEADNFYSNEEDRKINSWHQIENWILSKK